MESAKNTSAVGSFWKRVSGFRELTLILIIVGICILMSILSPFFATKDNLITTALSFAVNGIVVIGMTIVLVNGGIDLSVGSIMGLCGVVAGRLYQVGTNIWIAAIIALVLGRPHRGVQRVLHHARGPLTVHHHPGHAEHRPRGGLREHAGHPPFPVQHAQRLQEHRQRESFSGSPS